MLEKIWAKYCAAGPLLFALSDDPKFDNSIFTDVEGLADWIKKFCADRKRISLFLARAASISATLKESGVRRVSVAYFKNIEPADIVVAPFTPEQVSYIKNMDYTADPKDDGTYRAPLKKR
jgi:hypothetical protein